MNENDKPNWYVSHPTFRYVEDVKQIARANGWRLVDANRVMDFERENAVDGPALTLRPEFGGNVQPVTVTIEEQDDTSQEVDEQPAAARGSRSAPKAATKRRGR
jgi:hypothetical protein